MGESRRRRERGSILQLDIISPVGVLVGPAPDKLHLAAIIETVARFHRDPPPVCGACEHEFVRGEEPALISILRPTFVAEGERVALICSGICSECARLDPPQLEVAVSEKLRSVNPSLERVPSGSA